MPAKRDERHFHMLFEHAPISLWEQDFSAIRARFGALRRQGVRDLGTYLDEHPGELDACMGLIKVVDVNHRTLELFGVRSRRALLADLSRFFRDEMRVHFRSELLALWDGQLSWSGEGINYTLDGRPLYILLSWRILPGSEKNWKQVLVSIEDVSALRQAERELRVSEARLRGLFENSPVSLWEEDYREIKSFFDRLRTEGVEDLEAYIEEHPDCVARCMAMIRVVDVNRRTLEVFGAKSKQQLLSSLDQVFRDEMGAHFRQELLHLWQGRLAYDAEGINYTLSGEPIYIHLHLTVFPGCEATFERVLVAIEDVTARHQAEEYLRYLGTHDVMTGLYNRAYYQDELKRLDASRPAAVAVVAADLDGLKEVNDGLGHEAGDNLIRRAAEVLKAGFRTEDVIARIGGDEFVVLMPGAQAEAAREAIERVESLIKINNKFYGEPLLRISFGVADRQAGDEMRDLTRAADRAMYRHKRARQQGEAQERE